MKIQARFVDKQHRSSNSYNFQKRIKKYSIGSIFLLMPQPQDILIHSRDSRRSMWK